MNRERAIKRALEAMCNKQPPRLPLTGPGVAALVELAVRESINAIADELERDAQTGSSAAALTPEPGLCDFELKVLRDFAGQPQEGLSWGAAMSAALEVLKGRSLVALGADGCWRATELGRELLARLA